MSTARDTPITARMLLGPELAQASDEQTRAAVGAALDGLLGELGIAAPATVELEAAAENTFGPLALWIDGQRCRFPCTLPYEALAYAEGTPRVPSDAASFDERLAAHLSAADVSAAGEFAASVCRSAVALAPEVLASGRRERWRALLELGIALPAAERADDRETTEGLIAAGAAGNVEIRVAPAYLRALTATPAAREMFAFARASLSAEVGVALPPLHLHADASLPDRGFCFRINSVTTLPRIGLDATSLLVNETREQLGLFDVDAEPTLNPASRRPGAITSADAHERLESVGYTTWDPLQYLVLALAAELRPRIHALVTSELAAQMVQSLAERYPRLGEIAAAHIPPYTLAPVLRQLLCEDIPVRDLRAILEVLLRRITTTPDTSGGSLDIGAAVDDVRAGLSDTIVSRLAGGRRTVPVYLLEPALEDAIVAERTVDVAGQKQAQRAQRVVDDVAAELAVPPPYTAALLTRSEVRRPLSELLRAELPHIRVIAYHELPKTYNVQPLNRIGVNDPSAGRPESPAPAQRA